jgi:hypothetical protein
MTTLESAVYYIQLGLAPVPVPRGEKAPRTKSWQKLQITEAEAPRYFNGSDQNIGILMGEPSGNLVDVDLDCAETVALAPQFLPQTEWTFGRPSKRQSHWLYRAEPLIKTKKYADPTDKAMLVEIRSTGCQTVFPPSVHPCGEPITFDCNGDPAKLEGTKLLGSVGILAAGALLARHWPEKGSRNDTALALGGALIEAGWPEEDAAEFIRVIAETAGDEEANHRAQTVDHTAQKHDAGQPTTGWPRLAEILDPTVVQKVQNWLGISKKKRSEVTEKVIDELNAKHAVVWVGGKCAVLKESFDPVLGGTEITLCSPADFRTYFGNRKVFNGEKTVGIGSYWLSHPKRRQYEGIVFAPGHETPKHYNLYQGFAVEPKSGDCSLYLGHIHDVIASGDDEIYDYTIAWMADAVQNPDKRPGTAIVLRGLQGVGKGVFCSEFGKLFGPHFVRVYHSKHLTGNFNAHLKSALIVLADEAFWAGDKAGEGALKAMITEEFLPIEFKGKDAIYVRNHIRLLVASNSDWVVPAGLEERRFFVIDVSEARMQDRRYFGAIVDQMENGGREALLDFLLNYDLNGIDLGKFPQTDALREQKILSMPPVHKWWYGRLMDGAVLSTDYTWRTPIECHLVHEDFIQHSGKTGFSRRATETELGTTLKKLVPDMRKRRLTKDKRRPWGYELPPLEECRAAFDRLTRNRNPWPEED